MLLLVTDQTLENLLLFQNQQDQQDLVLIFILCRQMGFIWSQEFKESNETVSLVHSLTYCYSFDY